jgi:dUTP pyrophosphatase
VNGLSNSQVELLRCGVTVNTAVWDAGYSGRSESLLVVYQPEGFDLQKNARIVQLVFFQLIWRDGRLQRNLPGGEHLA